MSSCCHLYEQGGSDEEEGVEDRSSAPAAADKDSKIEEHNDVVSELVKVLALLLPDIQNNYQQ